MKLNDSEDSNTLFSRIMDAVDDVSTSLEISRIYSLNLSHRQFGGKPVAIFILPKGDLSKQVKELVESWPGETEIIVSSDRN